MSGLKLAPRFELPLDVAGEAIAILAKRGAGKTNTARVLVEELAAHHVQVVVLDPVGAWWGLRSSADGQKKGLAFPIMGGQHADVELAPTAGELMANVAVDSGQSLVLDLSDFPSKSDIRRFTTDFAETLYRRKNRESSALHLVLEEADVFAPQRVRAGDREAGRMQSAIEQIVRRGRARGLGITMITQRSAVLSKDVLTQADVLIAMRTTGPQDSKAIREWVESRADGGREVLDSLPGLATGEAWVWNPERDILHDIHVRRSRTFDSGRTPKVGERVQAPKQLAPIDLEDLGERIQATVEKQRQNDPAQLRRQVRDLERQLAEAQKAPAAVETIEVPAIDAQTLKVLENTVHDLQGEAASLTEFAAFVGEALKPVVEGLQRISGVRAPLAAEGDRKREPPRPQPSAPQPSPSAAATPAALAAPVDVTIGKGERKVLDVLAEYPDGRTQNEVAFLAGYSAKASTIGVILSNLRRAGLVEQGQPIRLTAEGFAYVGGPRERLTGQALLNQWLQHPRMGEGERKVLRYLIERYPNEPSHDELCDATGYSPNASTMGVILSKLRKLGLVQKGARRVAPEFIDAIEQ